MSRQQLNVGPTVEKQHYDIMDRANCHPDSFSHVMQIARDETHHPCEHKIRHDTNKASLSPELWFRDDEELSPRASKYYSDLLSLYTQRQPTYVSSMSEDHAAHHPGPQAATARTPSTVTVFPCPIAQEMISRNDDAVQRPFEPENTAPSSSVSLFQKHYQKAKVLYRNGPPGEAELFWGGIKSYLEAKKQERNAVLEMCPLKEASAASQKPPDSAVSYGDISRTSREVPIKLRRTVLTVDLNKPLPPSPPLSTVPCKRPQKGKGKEVDMNKPLPRTPFPCFDEPKASDGVIIDSPVDAHWPPHQQTVSTEAPSQHPEALKPGSHEHAKPPVKEQQPVYYQPLPKIPTKEQQAHAALKAKISYPFPMPSPTLSAHPGLMSAKAKGKQKAPSSPSWLDKLAHPTIPALPALALHKLKRTESDDSFVCRGLRRPRKGEVYIGVEQQEGILKPLPLFTGRRANGSFYDVSDESADQRATGRWI